MSEPRKLKLSGKMVVIKMDQELPDRKTTLLKAAYDLLMKQEESSITLNLLEETVHYDEADCDGSCLMDDIASELNL
jgi:hypothetical protein